ncbi:MAG: hypothetical protein ACI9C4_001204, partial [Paraglaciecola sp.]
MAKASLKLVNSTAATMLIFRYKPDGLEGEPICSTDGLAMGHSRHVYLIILPFFSGVYMDNKPWYAAGCKGIGRSRKINKDAFLDGSAVGMWCVANGLIGHAKGELASRMIVDYLTRLNCAELFPLSPAQIDQCLHVVNAQLVALAARELPGEIMGSTAAVLILGHAQAHFLWA